MIIKIILIFTITLSGIFQQCSTFDPENIENTESLLSITAKYENNNTLQCGSPEMLHTGKFSLYDYGVVIAMLIISLGIGIFYGFLKKSDKNIDSSNDFLLGTGMSLFPVTLSLTTNFITAIELLGNPVEMYYRGTQFSLIIIPMIIVIPVAVKIFYPIYFKLELTSCYEYLGIRFGKEIRIMGAVLYIIQMSFYTSVAVLAPAVALSSATGLSIKIAVILIYAVCVFYSSQGGMKAVVIADTFQAMVLAFSLILIVILGSFYTSGFSGIIETAAKNYRLEFFNFDFDPTKTHTVWSVIIGGFFYWTSLLCTNQASVQKCMSLKKLKLASIALGCSIIGLVLVFSINFYTGLMVFKHYSTCDPLTAGKISATDQLLPFYIMNVFGHMETVTGIFVAGIFAASLGTVASALNSLSAVTSEDILINGLNIEISPENGAKYVKWMSLGYGIFSFVLVFIVERLGGVLQATLTLNGLVGGVTLGLFILGIAFKKANTKGALFGALISLVIVIYIGVMAQIHNSDEKLLSLSVKECDCYLNETLTASFEKFTNPNEYDLKESSAFDMSAIYKISYMWYTMIGAFLTIIFGLLLSILFEFYYKATQNKNEIKINESVTATKLERKISLQNNLKNHIILEPEMLQSKKIGIDNYALNLTDEK